MRKVEDSNEALCTPQCALPELSLLLHCFDEWRNEDLFLLCSMPEETTEQDLDHAVLAGPAVFPDRDVPPDMAQDKRKFLRCSSRPLTDKSSTHINRLILRINSL